MEAFSGYIQNIAVFLILQSFVRMILPHNRYRNYIDFVLGLLMISLVIGPVTTLLDNREKPLDLIIPKLTYRLNYTPVKNNEYLLDTQNKMVLSAYQEELKKQLTPMIPQEYQMHSAEFAISEEEESFGDIVELHLVLSRSDQEDEKKDQRLIRIDNVKLQLPNKLATEGLEQKDTDEIWRIKNQLGSFYNLSPDNIYITFEEM